jgi:glycosyltransferase involved in cell wall biosynthesis
LNILDSFHSKKFSKLIIHSDGADWVLDSIKLEMIEICRMIGIQTIEPSIFRLVKNQCVFYTSKYDVLENWKTPKNRIAFPYYHGNPSSNPQFRKLINNLIKYHKDIFRVQVSNSEVEDIIINTGIDSDKVFRIPISIDLGLFPQADPLRKKAAREKMNISESALVIGSFQKDGNGWGEGNEPKFIKGPDIFLQTIKMLKDEIPDLHVLLTGSSRGYVKTGLDKMNVSYHHFLLKNYIEISQYYHALDLYLVTSREEGGPRAILESMASGIPLVTTRVGQAMDLVKHEKNGWMVDVEDVEGLAHWVKYVIETSDSLDDIKLAARKTAEENCYKSQIPIWKKFMEGFVNF